MQYMHLKSASSRENLNIHKNTHSHLINLCSYFFHHPLPGMTRKSLDNGCQSFSSLSYSPGKSYPLPMLPCRPKGLAGLQHQFRDCFFQIGLLKLAGATIFADTNIRILK